MFFAFFYNMIYHPEKAFTEHTVQINWQINSSRSTFVVRA